MEKAKSVRNGNGGLQLPIGFRFHPTDEELLVHYLKRKVFSFPLPASIIPELDVFQTNPWDLPGDSKEKRYFFSKRKGEANKCSGISISCGSGYWKAIGKDKPIFVAPGSKQPVGMKKSLVFYQGKRPHGLKTRWVMHEYRLVGSGTAATEAHGQKVLMRIDDWVVCRICQRKRRAKKGNKSWKTEVITPSIMDFKMEESTDLVPPQPSSSCSSGITQDSCNELDQEASGAYTTFFPHFPV